MSAVFDSVLNTTDQSIDRVLATGLPTAFVFLDGKASDALVESMNRLASANAGRLLVVQIQAKDNPESVRRYHTIHTPAVVAVRNSQVISRAESITPATLDQHVAFLLGQGPQPPHDDQGSSAAGTKAASADIRNVTDATFEKEVTGASGPVLVDFWAEWCGPCRSMEPITTRLAHSLAGRLRIAKVNVDENPVVSQRFGVQSIPTMMLVKNGQVVDRWSGAMPESAIRGRISRFVS